MRVLTENEIRNLTRRTDSGGKFNLPADTILTPLARDFLRSKGIDIVEPVRAHGIAAGAGEGGAKKEPEDALVDAVASEVTRLLRDGGGKGQGSSSESAVAIPGRGSGSGPSGSAIRRTAPSARCGRIARPARQAVGHRSCRRRPAR